MNYVISLLALIGSLFLGLLTHRLPIKLKPTVVESLTAWLLYGLLASMGLRLSQNREIVGLLPKIGLLALVTALATAAGAVGALRLFGSWIHQSKQKSDQTRAIMTTRGWFFKQLRGPLKLMAVVVGSFLVGLILPPLEALATGSFTNRILYGLLVLIGWQMAQKQVSWTSLLFKPATLMLPVLSALGSLVGVLIVWPLFSVSLGEALALGAGFGWYSLSGILIADLGDPALGSVAFLANLFREVLALLAIPWLSSTGRPELAIGIGGATSMDVTLPLIERCNGPAVVPAALSHGLILSFLVPVLVPLFYRLA